MEKERRGFDLKEIRLENEDDSTYLEGHGIVFNKMSRDLGGFREVIKPEAVEEVLGNDVRGLMNHDKNLVLGRTKSGTMQLTVDGDGLKYRIQLPDTTAGRDAAESVRRGDIDGSSFGFRVAEDGDKWERREDGTVVRTVTKLERLFDVGPVTYPAYEDTNVATRDIDKLVGDKKENNKETEEESNEQPDYGLRKLTIRKHKLENKKAII